MAQDVYRQVIDLVLRASRLAQSIGISNLFQPGLIKEMIIADLLGHQLIHSKRDADACSYDNPNEKYKYLSYKEGGSGQLDRMFSRPDDKRAESLTRITRNAKIFYAIFYADDQTKCKVIYELDPDVVLLEANRQLDQTRNAISHVGFSIRWARENGKVVYEDTDT